MGAFICSISERDWELSLRYGIYGNKKGKLLESGDYKEFSPTVKYSIIRDLAGMKEGDVLFFHVIRKGVPSSIHGVYSVRGEPFYDESEIWDDNNEIFPYRFLVSPHPDYEALCKYDASIDVINFYELIEKRKIWSLATLENEVNLEARSVRKIEGNEANEIIRLLHRDFRQRKKMAKTEFKLISSPKTVVPLHKCISDIGRYENSIKALLMYKLKTGDKEITNAFGKVIDFFNEVYIAQTTRKLIDILCIAEKENGYKYILSEVKTDKCDKNSLVQLLYYMDLFKQKDKVNLQNDAIMGVLIGKSFDKDVIDFAKERNMQGVNGSLILLGYEPTKGGNDANIKRVV